MYAKSYSLDKLYRIRLLVVSAAVVALCVSVSEGISAGPVSADPNMAATTIIATNIENAGVELTLSAGKFIEASAANAVEVIDADGSLLERLLPNITVDDRIRNLEFEILDNGARLKARIADGVGIGAKIVEDFISVAGPVVKACFAKGLPTAIEGALIAAFTGAVWSLTSSVGVLGIVLPAAVAGTAGAWQGFARGCADGVSEYARVDA